MGSSKKVRGGAPTKVNGSGAPPPRSLEKLPPLRPRADSRGARIDSPTRGYRVSVVEDAPPPRKFRDPATVEAARAEFQNSLKELADDRAALDAKLAEVKPRLDRIEEIQAGKNQPMSTEEQVLILEAYFSRKLGPAAIAQEIGRPSSTVTRFIQRHISTAPIAKALIGNSAETLARRIIKHANVTESLEILDRVDALPKKRDKDATPTQNFNIIVGMPGAKSAPAIPDQAAIEAALVDTE